MYVYIYIYINIYIYIYTICIGPLDSTFEPVSSESPKSEIRNFGPARAGNFLHDVCMYVCMCVYIYIYVYVYIYIYIYI